VVVLMFAVRFGGRMMEHVRLVTVRRWWERNWGGGKGRGRE
jgi:hypothetical protein